MCCSDPDSVARLDVLDLDPVVPPDTLVRDDGLVWMNTAGQLYVSRNEGQIFVLAYQGQECDGLTEPGSWEVVACTSARVEPVRFDSTLDPRTIASKFAGRLDIIISPPPIPPEKIAAARKAIDAITARAKGLAGIEWPAGWYPVEIWPGCKVRPFRPDEPVMACPRLPDTERGRRAAWELEGA